MKKSALPTWNLADMYPSRGSEKIRKDILRARKLAEDFAETYEGKVEKLSADKLAQSITDYEVIAELMGKLESYAYLVYAENMDDAAGVQFFQNTSEQVNEISTKLVFYSLALNRITDKDLNAKLKQSAKLRHYQPWLRDVRAFKPYQLDDQLEKLIHDKQVVDQAWVRLYDESQARLRFPIEGKSLTLTQATELLASKDATKRKTAAKAIGKVLGENAPTTALVTNTLAKNKEISDRWRGYARPISSRNVANQVEDEVVDALVTTVKANYKQLSHRYYQWKAKQFGKKQIEYWDRNAPLPKSGEGQFTWPQAKEIVLSAYTAFSPEMAKVGQNFFDRNWIDVPARPGKASGAFAHPTVPSSHPYLLLNFSGKTRDVMTLAHELGHGVHQVLSASQGALMCDTPLTLAETASVFGEMLVFQELLRREKNAEKRKYLIAAKVEDMLNTVVRQIAFCEFERLVHDARRQGELTADQIGEIWMGIMSQSLGPAIRLHPEYQYYWSYISHFIHAPFYVYAYAFGDCLVNSLYAVYQKESKAGRAKSFEKKYLEMLSAGGTLRHKELLKPFGLDASKPDFWQHGLNMVKGFIDQLD